MRRSELGIFVYFFSSFSSVLWDEWQAYRHHVVGDASDWLYGAFQAGFAIFCVYRAIRLTLSKQLALASVYGLIFTAIVSTHIFSHEIEHAKMWGRAAFFETHPSLCRRESPGDEHFDICYHYYYSLGWGFVGPSQWLVLDDGGVLGEAVSDWQKAAIKKIIESNIQSKSMATNCEFFQSVPLAWHMYWISGKC